MCETKQFSSNSVLRFIGDLFVSFPDAKRLIGRKFDDPSVQSDMKHWPFNIRSDGGKPRLEVEYKGETKTFFPEEISSMVLVKMKETAEAYLGKVYTINEQGHEKTCFLGFRPGSNTIRAVQPQYMARGVKRSRIVLSM